jgi:hypothetical protein
MYLILVTRKDGSLRSDFQTYQGPTPCVASEINHQVGADIMRLRITNIRSPAPIAPSTVSWDLVEATEA